MQKARQAYILFNSFEPTALTFRKKPSIDLTVIQMIILQKRFLFFSISCPVWITFCKIFSNFYMEMILLSYVVKTYGNISRNSQIFQHLCLLCIEKLQRTKSWRIRTHGTQSFLILWKGLLGGPSFCSNNLKICCGQLQFHYWTRQSAK